MLEFVHMMPLERPIWRRYLERTDLVFTRLEYDLHLGRGSPIDPTWPAWLQRQVRAVSRKRVDVVGHTASETIIFEVKPRAGMSALGQCLCYRALYLREKRTLKPVRMMVVCERVEPDVPSVLAAYNVEVAVV